MGTRNLTAVKIDGEYKIAQYGQWDGYPGGQGMTCLNFLRETMDEDKFKAALRKCTFITNKELSDLWSKYTDSKDGWVTIEEADRMKRDYPEFSRDTGAGILELVQNSDGMELQNEIAFAADSVFCEWAWVIDFDERTFEGYKGFNKEPLTENDRFYFLKDYENDGYYGVKLAAKFSLNNLPTDEEFLDAFNKPQQDMFKSATPNKEETK